MKKYIIVTLLIIVVSLIARNHEVVTNPNQALLYTIASKKAYEWKVDLLLWRGADATYKDNTPYHLMLMREHYHLIEKFGEIIPENDRKEIYALTLEYELEDDIRNRIKKSLFIE